jgi:hypothetical protein
VIVGLFVADNSRARMASGEVRASIAARRAAVDVSPAAENTTAGAANTWSPITIDAKQRPRVPPTSSPSSDYYGSPPRRQPTRQPASSLRATGEFLVVSDRHHDPGLRRRASPPLSSREGGRWSPWVEDWSPLSNASRATTFPIQSARSVERFDVKLLRQRSHSDRPRRCSPADHLATSGVRRRRNGRMPDDVPLVGYEGAFTPPAGAASLFPKRRGMQWGGMTWDPPRGRSSRL